MPVIGNFSAVKDGYAGTIRTLTVSTKVRLIVNDRKEGEAAPDFRIMAGAAEIGAAWRKTKQGSDETYLRVKLDDPTLPQPIWGWFAQTDQFAMGPTFMPQPDIRRVLLGTPSILALAAADEGIGVTIEAGIEMVAAKAQALTGFGLELCDQLGLRSQLVG